MPIPHVTLHELEAAMQVFDEVISSEKRWANWENNRKYLYAMEWKGRKYPVKKVISIATNHPVWTFNRGKEANDYVEQRCGKCIVKLPR